MLRTAPDGLMASALDRASVEQTMGEVRRGDLQAGPFGEPSPAIRRPTATRPGSPGTREPGIVTLHVADGTVSEWHARGGRTWVGTVLPLLIGTLGAVAIAAAICALIGGKRAPGPGPAAVLLLLAALDGWLVRRVIGTVWLVRLSASDHFFCASAVRTWRLAPGEILAVKGNAYGLLLVLVTSTDRIWLWDLMDDRHDLLAAIRRSSPAVEFDRYVCRPVR